MSSQQKPRLCVACGEERPASEFSKYGAICTHCWAERRQKSADKAREASKWANLTDEQKARRLLAMKKYKANMRAKKAAEARGERFIRGSARLSKDQVRFIRTYGAPGKLKRIAKELKLGYAAVLRAFKGITYKEVK